MFFRAGVESPWIAFLEARGTTIYQQPKPEPLTACTAVPVLQYSSMGLQTGTRVQSLVECLAR